MGELVDFANRLCVTAAATQLYQPCCGTFWYYGQNYPNLY